MRRLLARAASIGLIGLGSMVLSQFAWSDANVDKVREVERDLRELAVYFSGNYNAEDIRLFLDGRFIGRPNSDGLFRDYFPSGQYELKVLSPGYEFREDRVEDKRVYRRLVDLDSPLGEAVELRGHRCCRSSGTVYIDEGDRITVTAYTIDNERIEKQFELIKKERGRENRLTFAYAKFRDVATGRTHELCSFNRRMSRKVERCEHLRSATTLTVSDSDRRGYSAWVSLAVQTNADWTWNQLVYARGGGPLLDELKYVQVE